MEKIIKVGVGVMIRKGGKILLGHRCKKSDDTGGIFEPGTWTFPGGKQEFGESIFECAKREVKEETNLDISDFEIFGADDDIQGDRHFVTLWVTANEYSGILKIEEPQKIDKWEWFSVKEIPINIYTPTKKFIQAYINKNSEKGEIIMSKKFLVAYFSCGEVTKKVAQNIAAEINGDIFEIKPKVPYTSADLDWMDKQSRSSLEMKDLSSRPEFIKKDIDMAQYDAVFLGFPIWWYVAPTIVNTFLESYDFSGKAIIPFCTSGGSGLGKTVEHLQPSVDGSAVFKEGKLLNGNPSREELKKWVETLEL